MVEKAIKSNLTNEYQSKSRSRRKQNRWENRWFAAGGVEPVPPTPNGCFSDSKLLAAINVQAMSMISQSTSSVSKEKDGLKLVSVCSWADKCKQTVTPVKRINRTTGEKVINAFSKITGANLYKVEDKDNRYILDFIKNNFLNQDVNMDKDPYVKSTAGDGDALWKVCVHKCLRNRGTYAGNPINRTTTLGTFVDRLCSNEWQARWTQHIAGLQSSNFLHQWGTVVEAIFFVICDEFSEKMGILIVNTFLTHCEREFRNVGIAGGCGPGCSCGRRSKGKSRSKQNSKNC